MCIRDRYDVRFSVDSGTYPNGEAFQEPGNCFGQYSINSQCEIQEAERGVLSATGFIKVPTECFEIDNND